MTLFNTQIFNELEQHADHSLRIATYQGNGGIANFAIECRDCELVVHDIEPEPANGFVTGAEPTGEDPDGTIDVASDSAELVRADGPINSRNTDQGPAKEHP